MIGARRGSPLAIGHGSGEMYLGSDAIALAPFTDTISYLEDGDWAVIQRGGVQIRDAQGVLVNRAQIKTTGSAFLVDKGNHRHFMAKEIHEQPEVVAHTLSHYLDMANERVVLPGKLPFDFAKLDRISISACGTAFYAGLIAKYWFERYARIAGRNRYRLRIPLPRGAAAQGRPCDLRVAIGRDRRHACVAALCARSRASTCSPSSTCSRRPSRAKAT